MPLHLDHNRAIATRNSPGMVTSIPRESGEIVWKLLGVWQ
jgi:hypothetical protein